jgi:hypothetical protein
MAAAIAAASLAPAVASTNGTTTVRWYANKIVRFNLTPNYAAGFGTIKGGFGAPPPPSPGPNALFQGGSVDFGTVIQGNVYLYRYAAHLNVQTNAPGFSVFAEGSADFTGTGANAGNTLPVNQTIFWLNSSAGGGDSNTAFSPSNAFQRTMQGGASYNNPSITYGTYPAPALTGLGNTADYYFDYQMKLPSNASVGSYYVYVVYTVVPT